VFICGEHSSDEFDMLALSVRQPYAELILRGIKTVEYRSRRTRIIGERFYIYAAGKKWNGARARPVWSRDLSTSNAPPPWMGELANALRLFNHELPSGVIVGSAVIEKVSQRDAGMWQWHLANVERAKSFRKPKRHPQPVWFEPF
jgi:hypothetical protein